MIHRMFPCLLVGAFICHVGFGSANAANNNYDAHQEPLDLSSVQLPTAEQRRQVLEAIKADSPEQLETLLKEQSILMELLKFANGDGADNIHGLDPVAASVQLCKKNVFMFITRQCPWYLTSAISLPEIAAKSCPELLDACMADLDSDALSNFIIHSQSKQVVTAALKRVSSGNLDEWMPGSTFEADLSQRMKIPHGMQGHFSAEWLFNYEGLSLYKLPIKHSAFTEKMLLRCALESKRIDIFKELYDENYVKSYILQNLEVLTPQVLDILADEHLLVSELPKYLLEFSIQDELEAVRETLTDIDTVRNLKRVPIALMRRLTSPHEPILLAIKKFYAEAVKNNASELNTIGEYGKLVIDWIGFEGIIKFGCSWPIATWLEAITPWVRKLLVGTEKRIIAGKGYIRLDTAIKMHDHFEVTPQLMHVGTERESDEPYSYIKMVYDRDVSSIIKTLYNTAKKAFAGINAVASDLFEAIENDNPDEIQEFFARQSGITVKPDDVRFIVKPYTLTPLQMAVMSCKPRAVEYLAKHTASIYGASHGQLTTVEMAGCYAPEMLSHLVPDEPQERMRAFDHLLVMWMHTTKNGGAHCPTGDTNVRQALDALFPSSNAPIDIGSADPVAHALAQQWSVSRDDKAKDDDLDIIKIIEEAKGDFAEVMKKSSETMMAMANDALLGKNKQQSTAEPITHRPILGWLPEVTIALYETAVFRRPERLSEYFRVALVLDDFRLVDYFARQIQETQSAQVKEDSSQKQPSVLHDVLAVYARMHSSATSSANMSLVELLLALPGVDINAYDPLTGATALSLATQKQDLWLVSRLLTCPDVDVNRPDLGTNRTPLYHVLFALLHSKSNSVMPSPESSTLPDDVHLGAILMQLVTTPTIDPTVADYTNHTPGNLLRQINQLTARESTHMHTKAVFPLLLQLESIVEKQKLPRQLALATGITLLAVLLSSLFIFCVMRIRRKSLSFAATDKDMFSSVASTSGSVVEN